MSVTGNRMGTRSQSHRIQTSDENTCLPNDFVSGLSISQAVSDTLNVSRPPILTGSQSMYTTTHLVSSSSREPEFQSSFPRPSFSWSMGDTNTRENEIVRGSGRTNVETCMKEMQYKMERLEGTFFSVTNQLKCAIEGLRPSNNISQSHSTRDSSRERDDRGADGLYENNSGSRRLGNRQYESSSSSEDEMSDRSSVKSSHNRTSRSTCSHPKLPPFTGKETWKVWFNRFEEVASRQRWSDDERLDQMIPKLQGVAGEFVFSQLPRSVRSDYKGLCKELKNRFRVVETSKTFGVQFSHRNQKNGETVEEYAAELKKLYDKAHARRDKETRREDLLRRFLDGLIDEKARFHVEFVKEPNNIDEAVFQVVSFLETKQTAGKVYDTSRSVRNATNIQKNDSDSDSDDMRIARSLPGKNKNRIIKRDESSKSTVEQNKTDKQEIFDLSKLRDIVREELKNIHPLQLPNSYPHPFRQQGNRLNFSYNGQNQNRSYNDRKNKTCFYCHEPSHFKKDCPKLAANTARTDRQAPTDPVTNQSASSNPRQALN